MVIKMYLLFRQYTGYTNIIFLHLLCAICYMLQLHAKIIQNRNHDPVAQGSNADRNRNTQIKVNALFK